MPIYNWSWQLYKNKKYWNAKQLFHYVHFPQWCAYPPPHTLATSICISAHSQNQNFLVCYTNPCNRLSWEAPPVKKFPAFITIHITPILTTVLSSMNPIHHTFPPYFLEIHTIYHKFNLVSEFDGINQKAAQLISQLVDSNTSTFMPNPINMSHISVHSVSRQVPWIFSILDRYHSIFGLWRTIKCYSLPLCFLSESKC